MGQGDRRRRHKDPGWRTLKFILCDGPTGLLPDSAYVANVLYGQGYESPERLRHITDEELNSLPIGRKGKARVRIVRNLLNGGGTCETNR